MIYSGRSLDRRALDICCNRVQYSIHRSYKRQDPIQKYKDVVAAQGKKINQVVNVY